MDTSHIGAILVLLIIIYFLFRLGHALATGYFNNPFYPWVGAIFLFLMGLEPVLDNKNPAGFLWFIPICTYILLKLFDGLSFETSLKQRSKAVVFSAGSSIIVYLITHHFFHFGVMEASLGSIIAAFILGKAGFTS
ncbi:hypothetical protein BIU88_05365 [Chlorobaculum limnaeum]|uniref:Uncharacterized protein n=1 Tax=Chlorobaculum limnaeum TaxID=274537 RepID=A0A1D8CXG7_CHLLM|nr:hypothetical protein [Chlorobaculum limnaeum]AOS83626.1 hypothetical protein BIU88_05365 [Chlorobaculum limnaeum]